MGDPVVRFEIGCKDRPAAKAFYEAAFGWRIGAGEITGEADTGAQAGINGALTALGHEPHNYVMVYIGVADINRAAEKVVENGGAVHIGPLEIPGGKGRFAWIKDPEGNMLGLFQAPG